MQCIHKKEYELALSHMYIVQDCSSKLQRLSESLRRNTALGMSEDGRLEDHDT